MIALLPPMRANSAPKPPVIGVSPRFLHVVKNVLVAPPAIRILHRHIDLREDAQIVKPPLRIGHGGRRKRIARSSIPAACSTSVRARGFEPGDHHLAHRLLLAFVDRETQVHRVGLGPGLRIPLERGIGKTVARRTAAGSFRGRPRC